MASSKKTDRSVALKDAIEALDKVCQNYWFPAESLSTAEIIHSFKTPSKTQTELLLKYIKGSLAEVDEEIIEWVQAAILALSKSKERELVANELYQILSKLEPTSAFFSRTWIALIRLGQEGLQTFYPLAISHFTESNCNNFRELLEEVLEIKSVEERCKILGTLLRKVESKEFEDLIINEFVKLAVEARTITCVLLLGTSTDDPVREKYLKIVSRLPEIALEILQNPEFASSADEALLIKLCEAVGLIDVSIEKFALAVKVISIVLRRKSMHLVEAASKAILNLCSTYHKNRHLTGDLLVDSLLPQLAALTFDLKPPPRDVFRAIAMICYLKDEEKAIFLIQLWLASTEESRDDIAYLFACELFALFDRNSDVRISSNDLAIRSKIAQAASKLISSPNESSQIKGFLLIEAYAHQFTVVLDFIFRKALELASSKSLTKNQAHQLVLALSFVSKSKIFGHLIKDFKELVDKKAKARMLKAALQDHREKLRMMDVGFLVGDQ